MNCYLSVLLLIMTIIYGRRHVLDVFFSQLQFLKQNISSPSDMLVYPVESGLKKKKGT